MNRIFRNTLLATAGLLLAAPVAANAQTVGPEDTVPLSNWNYQELYEDSISIDGLIDEVEVFGPGGEEIGDIENVLFSADGRILSVIAEIGGFWDIGDTHVNIPWSEVKFRADREGITVPVTEETVENYSAYPDEMITETEARVSTEPVDDNLATGARVWRATELIGDYVRIREDDVYVNYGYVRDILVKDDRIAAVTVRPGNVGMVGGPYAYPFYGYRYGWEPGAAMYDLPYRPDEITVLKPIDTAAGR